MRTSLLDEGLFGLCTLLPIWFWLIYIAEGTSETSTVSSNQEPAESSKDRRIRSPNTRRRDSSIRDPASFATPFTSSSSSSASRLFARLLFSRRFGFETRSTFSVMGYQTLLADTNTLFDGLSRRMELVTMPAGICLSFYKSKTIDEQRMYVGTKYESRRGGIRMTDIRCEIMYSVHCVCGDETCVRIHNVFYSWRKQQHKMQYLSYHCKNVAKTVHRLLWKSFSLIFIIWSVQIYSDFSFNTILYSINVSYYKFYPDHPCEQTSIDKMQKYITLNWLCNTVLIKLMCLIQFKNSSDVLHFSQLSDIIYRKSLKMKSSSSYYFQYIIKLLKERMRKYLFNPKIK